MQNKDYPKLRECPFCGEADLVERYRMGYAKGGELAHIIKCRRCGARTDYHDTMKAADRAWNRRADNERNDM